jgi:hypothetical protein
MKKNKLLIPIAKICAFHRLSEFYALKKIIYYIPILANFITFIK